MATLGVRLKAVTKAPGKAPSGVENQAIVLKDGIGYDPDKLLESVRGRYGQY